MRWPGGRATWQTQTPFELGHKGSAPFVDHTVLEPDERRSNAETLDDADLDPLCVRALLASK